MTYFITGTYGKELVFLGNGTTPATVLRLAGWHPPFTQQEANWLGLALLRAPEPTLNSFLSTLKQQEIGRKLYKKWWDYLGREQKAREVAQQSPTQIRQ